MRIVSAQSGVTRQQGTLVGLESCRFSVVSGSSTVRTFRGSNPGADELELYLDPLLR